jgi:hypothetical protein
MASSRFVLILRKLFLIVIAICDLFRLSISDNPEEVQGAVARVLPKRRGALKWNTAVSRVCCAGSRALSGAFGGGAVNGAAFSSGAFDANAFIMANSDGGSEQLRARQSKAVFCRDRQNEGQGNKGIRRSHNGLRILQ